MDVISQSQLDNISLLTLLLAFVMLAHLSLTEYETPRLTPVYLCVCVPSFPGLILPFSCLCLGGARFSSFSHFHVSESSVSFSVLAHLGCVLGGRRSKLHARTNVVEQHDSSFFTPHEIIIINIFIITSSARILLHGATAGGWVDAEAAAFSRFIQMKPRVA